MSGAEAGRRRRLLRLGLAAAGFGAVTLVSVLAGRPLMFTGFLALDDEGYMLIALRSFIEGGALYEEVFTQYGPFYYEAWGTVFLLFDIPVDLESGRIATLVAWVGASLLIGIASARLTGSVLLGLGVQMIVFAGLAVSRNEPMHPGGIAALILAAIVLVASLVGRRLSPGAMLALGAAVAALALVKVNLGAFAVAAVVLTCVVSYRPLRSRRWLRVAVEAAFVATPFVLVSGKLGEFWAREYALHVSLAALALVLALRARSADSRDPEELWWLGAGFVGAGAAILLPVLWAGTGPGGLFEGLIAQPLRQDDALTLPLLMSRRFLVFDAIALALAIAYWYSRRGRPQGERGGWGAALPLIAIVVGVEMALSLIGRTLPVDMLAVPAHHFYMLGFAWLALVPFADDERPGRFARLLLPPLAVMQAMHAFPVAGSQTLWSTFLLVPVGALCVAGGVRGLRAELGGRELRAAAALGALAAIALAVYVADVTLRQPLRDNRAAYDAAAPLGLPGADGVRVDPAQGELLREITAAIDANCGPSLVMLPGMNSFYLWSRRTPPTGFNATGWPTLYGDRPQREVIEATRSIEGLCLLENREMAEGWSAGRPTAHRLLRYLERGFEPLAEFAGGYRLLRRDRAAPGVGT